MRAFAFALAAVIGLVPLAAGPSPANTGLFGVKSIHHLLQILIAEMRYFVTIPQAIRAPELPDGSVL